MTGNQKIYPRTQVIFPRASTEILVPIWKRLGNELGTEYHFTFYIPQREKSFVAVAIAYC